jgi:hypothetical protein
MLTLPSKYVYDINIKVKPMILENLFEITQWPTNHKGYSVRTTTVQGARHYSRDRKNECTIDDRTTKRGFVR